MIFNSGTKNTSILEKYISDIECKTCEGKTEHLLVVYCKTFVLGLFYPLKWWSWDKQGYMKCRKCGRQTEVSEDDMNLPPKIYNYYKQTKVPLRYKVPLIVTLGSLILIGLLVVGGFFSALVSVITPVEGKIVGTWKDEYNTARLYVYKDSKYTYVGSDTIIFGEYKKNRGEIHFPFYEKENIITNYNISPLRLNNNLGGSKTFVKTKNEETSDVYRKEGNLWRIRPNHKESREELRSKILALLKFEKTRFEKALENKDNFVVDDPNSPIYFASNGYAVDEGTMLKWKYLFYDDEDWEKANRLMQKEFPREFRADQDNSMFLTSIDFLKLYTKKIEEADLKFLDKPDETIYE